MMKIKFKIGALLFVPLFIAAIIAFNCQSNSFDETILAYEVDLKKQALHLFWKDNNDKPLRSIQNLKNFVESKQQTLLFAMNAGMYKSDFTPQGLYIENNKTLANIDTGSGDGNFYLKPNGIFYITNNKLALVCKTNDFAAQKDIKYATQSGPILLENGIINPAFKEGSVNLNIRNGVGILPNNHVLFAMSKKEINFYDFAKFFQIKGCKNALYLDGFVSRTYLPEKDWKQTDGNFGVMIGLTK
jgi:uncharacterized protein YigE (DUF2233 family)